MVECEICKKDINEKDAVCTGNAEVGEVTEIEKIDETGEYWWLYTNPKDRQVLKVSYKKTHECKRCHKLIKHISFNEDYYAILLSMKPDFNFDETHILYIYDPAHHTYDQYGKIQIDYGEEPIFEGNNSYYYLKDLKDIQKILKYLHKKINKEGDKYGKSKSEVQSPLENV